MELSFSRGFSPGWLGGCDHKMLVPGVEFREARRAARRSVTAVRGRSVIVALRVGPSRRATASCLPATARQGDEQGGRVYESFRHRRRRATVELTFGHDSIDFARLQPGQQLWKTDDPELTAQLRKTFTGHEARSGALPLECRSARRGRRAAAHYRQRRERCELQRGIRRATGRGHQASAHAARCSNSNSADSAARSTNCDIFSRRHRRRTDGSAERARQAAARR